MMFATRADAGRQLAESLEHLEGEDVVVLGVARGGVEVAAEIARVRGWSLDIVIPRKVGAPLNPELGLGAIAPGVRVLDERMHQLLVFLGVGAETVGGLIDRGVHEDSRPVIERVCEQDLRVHPLEAMVGER